MWLKCCDAVVHSAIYLYFVFVKSKVLWNFAIFVICAFPWQPKHHCLSEFLHLQKQSWIIAEPLISFPLLLSADVIASQGVATIIAVDVGSEDNNDLTNYGDHISGWYLLWNKINPFAKKIRVCTLNREAHDVM